MQILNNSSCSSKGVLTDNTTKHCFRTCKIIANIFSTIYNIIQIKCSYISICKGLHAQSNTNICIYTLIMKEDRGHIVSDV